MKYKENEKCQKLRVETWILRAAQISSETNEITKQKPLCFPKLTQFSFFHISQWQSYCCLILSALFFPAANQAAVMERTEEAAFLKLGKGKQDCLWPRVARCCNEGERRVLLLCESPLRSDCSSDKILFPQKYSVL